MVQRGSTYVTGVNFKILANWTNLHAIATPWIVPVILILLFVGLLLRAMT